MKEEILDWKKGKFTPEVNHKEIYPRTKKPIPISVATGGSIESTIRTAELGGCQLSMQLLVAIRCTLNH